MISIDKLIDPSDKVTFLVGAGISMENPSNVPSAKEFVGHLVRLCVPSEEINTILEEESLRYEGFVELIQKDIDKSIKFLDFLETRTKPNLIHYFLANNIIKRNHVITTNFDYLIEYALMELLPNKKDFINPIILKEQYLELNNIAKLGDIKDFLLFKLHGSKRNIISSQSTSESLITTLSSLGKNREEGETFAIESYKKPIISKIIENSVLIILGYSGSDDFDIAPFLKEITNYKKIFWIDHISSMNLEDSKIFHVGSELDSNRTSKQEDFLFEIWKNNGIETYLIRSNTKIFISEILWNTLLKSIPQPDIKNDANLEYQGFGEWIRSLKEYMEIDRITKYKFAGNVHYSLSKWKDARRMYKTGLELAEEVKNNKEKAELLTNVASLPQSDLDYEKNIEMLHSAKEIYTNLGDYEGESNCILNIGTIYSLNGQFNNAIKYYEEALEVKRTINDLEGITGSLLNLGAAYDKLREFDKALSYYLETLNVVNQTGNLIAKAHALMNIGTIHRNSAEYNKALEYLKEALKIDKLLGNLPQQTVILNYIGLTYQDLEDYDKAIEYFNEGLQMANDIGDYESQASLFYSIGGFYSQINNESEAIKNWEKGLVICEKYKLLPIKLNILYLIGTMAYNKENYEEALKYYNLVLQTAQNIGDKNFLVDSYNNIAAVSYVMQDYETTYNSYLKILELLKEEDDKAKRAYYLRELGIAYYNYTGDAETAINILKDAVEIFEELKDSKTIEEIQKDVEFLQNQ